MRRVIACLLVTGSIGTLSGCGVEPGASVDELGAGPAAAPSGRPAPADESRLADGFAAIFEPYETMRLSLVEDRTEGLAGHAAAMATAARGEAKGFSAGSAGVAPESAAAVRRLLDAIGQQADVLAAAEGLEPTRAAFGDLSDSMLAYREALLGAAPLVAYCPMVDRSWLQSSEEIGNPFYGTEMPKCGEITSERSSSAES